MFNARFLLVPVLLIAAAGARAQSSQPGPDLSQPTLFVVGYAHLDTQWRWSYAQTIREYLPNTLHDNFKLFEKYPNYVFNFTGSRRYQMMKEYYPEDYAKMKEYIAAGRWFPAGSSVDENDVNIPSAESLVRQILYGNRYFRNEFKVASCEYMIPDCFGFPAALPSVLAHCGITGFSTQKLTWGSVVGIPFKVGVWEGPDGRSVTAALDPGQYDGDVKENLANSETWLKRIETNGRQSGVFADFHYYGTGDVGGAPKDASVKMTQESVAAQGPIKVIAGRADQLFKAITPEMQKKLPHYKGELELTEHSAGSATSEAAMKRWNRKNELLADAAERASVAAWWLGGRPYPAQKLENAWTLVLGSQMHDIVSGTALPKGYEFAWNDELLAANQFATVLEDATTAVASLLDTRGEGVSLVVFNPLAIERTDIVEAQIPADAATTAVTVTGPDGQSVPAQLLETTNKTARLAFLAKVPSLSYTVFHVKQGSAAPVSAPVQVQERRLENDFYVVKLNDDGDVASIFDKQTKRELLSGPARLALQYENPRQWPAWNMDWADRQLPAKAFAGAPATIRVVEKGPARVSIEVTREAEGSTIIQRIRLAAGEAGRRVEFDTQIDWRTRERSLRAAFPLTAANPTATYDIQTGVIERGNYREKQYEYPFHQWFDLTDAKGEYGVTVMSDCKYAADKPDDHTVRLTLLHTPGVRGGYTDQASQDLGRHHVLYAVSGHAGDWRTGRSFVEASRLNQPLIAFRTTAHEGAAGKSLSLLSSDNPNVTIQAVKKAEDSDEVIVRLREQSGAAAKGVHVKAPWETLMAREVDGQEREIGKAVVKGGMLTADIGGFELRAFALRLAPSAIKGAAVNSAPVSLQFDADVISRRSNRSDGQLNEQGESLPGDALPSSITAEGVTLKLGSNEDGQKNAVACRGQEIQLPAGKFSHAVLLAAADGDVQAELQAGGQKRSLKVQDWHGYIGQWDHRLWPGDLDQPAARGGDIVGIDPGFVKSDPVAWYCSHYNTPKGDTYYEYCYLFKYVVDLPVGAKTIRLPDDPRIKVFALSVVNSSDPPLAAAQPLFDTLADHVQDRPRVVPAEGQFADATDVRIEPTLYWRDGLIHYTTDGSEPTPQSPVYAGGLTLCGPTTIKAAVLRGDKLGPAVSAKLDINDKTPPSVKKVEAGYQSAIVRVSFSEPLDRSAADASHFAIEPAIAIKSAELSADARSVRLTLATAVEPKRPYELKLMGIKDASPAGNALAATTVKFEAPAPVFELATITREHWGTTIRDVAGLPVKGGEPFTLNLFVKMDKQPDDRTVIAGFGRCADTVDGAARYICKFPGGVHFWIRNRDASSRTAFDLNRWQMITASYDGTTLRLYKDGKRIGQTKVQTVDDQNLVQIAPKDPWEHIRQFDGELRGLTIWNTALEEDAIRALLEK